MRRSLVLALSFATCLGCTTSQPYTGKGDGSTGDDDGGDSEGRGGAIGAAGTGGRAGSNASGTAGMSRGGSGGATGVAGSTARGGMGGATAVAGRGGASAAGTGGTATARGGAGGSATGAAGATARGGSNGAAGAAAGSSGTAGATARGGSNGTAGAAAGSSGTAGAPGRGGSTGAGGTTGVAGSTGSGGAAPWAAGNPNGSCSSAIPSKGQAVDVSNPTTVVGTGSAASCTLSALQTAVTAGGVVTFNCGADPVTIKVTTTITVPSTKKTVIDGGRKVTLDGGGTTQIMKFVSANFQANDNGLTLQHIALINGKMTPTEMIPPAPAPCSSGWDDGQGGAIYMRDGYLVVIDSIFTNNRAADVGPDTGGGAIYVLGSKGGVWIVGSTFTNNQASNAGAVGGLFAELNVYNSLFSGNKATGHDANGDEPSKCDVINNDQHQTGSGGNGGAIYSDGNDVNVTLCGDAVLNNAAGTGAFGGGLFYTSNNFGGVLTIKDTTMTGNTGGHWTQAQSGSVDDVGTAVGTNCKSITLSNSTLQGV